MEVHRRQNHRLERFSLIDFDIETVAVVGTLFTLCSLSTATGVALLKRARTWLFSDLTDASDKTKCVLSFCKHYETEVILRQKLGLNLLNRIPPENAYTI